jgi:hypothetical protein
MISCPKCTCSLSGHFDLNKFCPSCGFEYGEYARLCLDCDKAYIPTYLFCPDCGKKTGIVKKDEFSSIELGFEPGRDGFIYNVGWGITLSELVFVTTRGDEVVSERCPTDEYDLKDLITYPEAQDSNSNHQETSQKETKNNTEKSADNAGQVISQETIKDTLLIVIRKAVLNKTHPEAIMIHEAKKYKNLDDYILNTTPDLSDDSRNTLTEIIGFTLCCVRWSGLLPMGTDFDMETMEKLSSTIINGKGELTGPGFFEEFEPKIWEHFMSITSREYNNGVVKNDDIVVYGRVYGPILLTIMAKTYDQTRLRSLMKHMQKSTKHKVYQNPSDEE